MPRRFRTPPPSRPKPTISDKDLIADTAHDIHFEAYRSFSRDQLLCHPRDAMELCKLVRSKLHRPHLKDEEILAIYLNAHKRHRFDVPSPRASRSPKS